MKFRAVYDTGVVLQAALSDAGPAARTLLRADEGEIQLYVSPRLRSEYEDTLNRDSLRAKYRTLTEQRITAILGRIDANARMIHPVPERYRYARDPKDEALLNLAYHVNADFLVTRDKDLLDLRDALPGVRIVDPVEFLIEYEKSQAIHEEA